MRTPSRNLTQTSRSIIMPDSTVRRYEGGVPPRDCGVLSGGRNRYVKVIVMGSPVSDRRGSLPTRPLQRHLNASACASFLLSRSACFGSIIDTVDLDLARKL